MTHTLHRQGELESLEEDFVVLTMSTKTLNTKGSGEKMRRLFEILEKHKFINYGDMKTGNMLNSDRDTIHQGIQDTSIVHFVFSDREIVGKVLHELKEAKLGTSVVISGLVEATDRLCKQAGLKMHTVEFSGGIHGKIEFLPEKPILEINTMCGHGMVANNLIKEMIRQVKRGKKTLEEAAIELSKPCQCGVFNTKRAEEVLKRLL